MQSVIPSLTLTPELVQTMQPHSTQNMYVQQSTGNNNNAGNNTARTNPQTSGGLYRGGPPPPNATQRGGGSAARHVHHVPTMYQPTMHQNVVLPAYAQFAPRQPTFSTPQFQYTHGPISTYYQYQYLTPIQQQPPPPPQAHQRSGVGLGVNTGVGGVPVGSTLPVQAGPNGPMAGPGVTAQTQLSLPAGAVLTNTVQQSVGNAATVLGVGSAATNAGQVNVPPSMVSVMSGNVATATPTQQTNRRRHQHRLKIIDPSTNKNILDEYNKQNNSNTENSDYQEHVAPIAATTIVSSEFSQQEAAGATMAPTVVILNNDTRSNMQFNIDVTEIPTQRDNALVVGQTPIVSAMSDAPSVEILSTPQKPRSKKIIPIVAPEGDEGAPTLNLYPEANTIKAHTPANQLSNTLDKYQQQTNTVIAAKQAELLQQTQQQVPITDSDIGTPAVIASVESTDKDDRTSVTGAGDSGGGGGYVSATADADFDADGGSVMNSEEIANIAEEIIVVEAAVAAATITASTETSPMPEVLDDLSGATPNTIQETVAVEVMKLMTTVAASSSSNELPIMEPSPIKTPAAADIKSVTDDETTTTTAQPNSNNNNNCDGKPKSGGNAAACDETDRVALQTQDEAVTPTADDADSAGNRKPTIDSSATTATLPDITDIQSSLTTTPTTTTAATTAPPVVLQSLISYNEGQWSPQNPTGKKQYNREQLLLLRWAKASSIQPDVNNSAILPQTNLLPSFMRTGGNNQHKRVQSMIYAVGGNRGSDNLAIGGGTGNNMNKQASMSGVQGRNSMKGGMIHVNLSLGQDVKLNETENAWRPSVLAKSDAEMDPNVKNKREKDELVRRVRGILNKLTPEKFNTLVEEIIKLKIDTPDKMDEVIVLVFEKAIDEPNFSVSYARLCHRLIMEVKARDERMESDTKSNLAHFRNALLDKTEREFTQNVSQSTAKEIKLQPIVDKIKKCLDPNEKAELEAFLEEEERKIRRRSGGTVRFIGELFKISMLTGKIIYSCIDTLLNPQSEDMLECLCKLLTTVGEKFELTPINPKESGRCYSLEKSISKMQAIALKSDKDGAKVSSRVRFMLQDVIDLRKNKWQSTRNEAPKTMGQIEKEAKNEQLSAQYMNYGGSVSSSGANGQSGNSIGNKRDNERGTNRYGGDGRASGYGGSHSQRGGGNDTGSLRRQQQNSVGGGTSHANGNNNNNNNDDNTWHVQTSKGSRSQAVDTNKLEGLLNQNLDTKKMGGLSQFQWINNVGRQSATPTTTPSNSFAALSSLMDKNSSSGERVGDRDRSGSRNKGSYNKGSMEREHRYNDRVMHTRAGSSTAQGSRENSTSRGSGGQQVRSMMNSNASSSLQKSASHSKYTQQMPPTARMPHKTSMSAAGGGVYRNDQQQSNSMQQQVSHSANVAPPAVFELPSDSDLKLIKSVISEVIEMAVASKRVPLTAVSCIKRIPDTQRCGFLHYILTEYLHLGEVGKFYRRYLAITTVNLIQQNHLSVDHFKLAYKEFAECANDLIVDIPELWLYIFEFTGPLIVKNILTVADLWHNSMKDKWSNMGEKFLKSYLAYCTREVGPSFTRSMWKKQELKWTDFVPDEKVIKFIESNKLEYIENEKKAPHIEIRDSQRHIRNIMEHIEHLLKEGSNGDSIIDYCNGNVVDIDKNFIRSLTTTLSNFAILYKDGSYKLKTEVFQKICVPVLNRYIDSQQERELECLYALQLLVHSIEHPRVLLSEFFGELYDGYVIPQDTFIKWRDSKDPSAGKGVAVKGLNPFFTHVLSAETSDENN